ncbi:MAG: hypothetical protein RLY71_4309, partial [Pseudomonadota bacterium]
MRSVCHVRPELIAQTQQQVPTGAPAGSRCKLATWVDTGRVRHEVTVAVRIDAQGRRREQFWCDGVRVERAVLLRLTCAEVECPHAVAVRAQWQAFHARRQTAASASAPAPASASALALAPGSGSGSGWAPTAVTAVRVTRRPAVQAPVAAP